MNRLFDTSLGENYIDYVSCIKFLSSITRIDLHFTPHDFYFTFKIKICPTLIKGRGN